MLWSRPAYKFEGTKLTGHLGSILEGVKRANHHSIGANGAGKSQTVSEKKQKKRVVEATK